MLPTHPIQRMTDLTAALGLHCFGACGEHVLALSAACYKRFLHLKRNYSTHPALRRDRQPLLADRRARDVALPILQREAFLGVVGDNRAQREATNLPGQKRRPAVHVRVAVQPKQRCVSPYLR